MLLALAIILFLAWAMGFTVFHVTVGAFHLLVLVAVVVLILHFVRGGRGPVV